MTEKNAENIYRAEPIYHDLLLLNYLWPFYGSLSILEKCQCTFIFFSLVTVKKSLTESGHFVLDGKNAAILRKSNTWKSRTDEQAGYKFIHRTIERGPGHVVSYIIGLKGCFIERDTLCRRVNGGGPSEPFNPL